MTSDSKAPLSGDDLRAAYPPVGNRAARKVIDRLDGHCRHFIELSPLCVVSTIASDGLPDVSPRGGAPGFVHIADQHTAILPDRPGNHRLDSLTNVAARPGVALLFMVPGIDETLRVYGNAEVLSLDDGERRSLVADGKSRTALYVHVQRAMFHCAKALMRSRLWDPDAQVDRATFPTMGEIVNDHTGIVRPAESQQQMRQRYEPTL